MTNEPVRTGVFLCRCEPTIDGVVDTKAVAASAWDFPNVVHVELLDYACFPEAQCYIKNAIADGTAIAWSWPAAATARTNRCFSASSAKPG